MAIYNKKYGTGSQLEQLVAQVIFKTPMLSVEEMKAEAERAWKTQPGCHFFGLSGFMAAKDKEGKTCVRQNIPEYSSDHAAQRQLVKKLIAEGLQVELLMRQDPGKPDITYHHVTVKDAKGILDHSGVGEGRSGNALCNAALNFYYANGINTTVEAARVYVYTPILESLSQLTLVEKPGHPGVFIRKEGTYED